MASVVADRASVEERRARGKAARRRTPRSAQAGWDPPADRADPVAILERQAETRVPALVPLRHGRMLASPLAFLRGSAAVMAADLAGLPDSGLEAQLCGDAHLANFGIFQAPDRRLVFDINDFDETLRRGDRFDRAIRAFADAYAEQNALDHRALQRAVEAGRLQAQGEPGRSG